MTCEEFRRTFINVHPFKTTRGMRAAMISHGIVCDSCHEFVFSGRTPTKEQIARGKASNEADAHDPEFFETVDLALKTYRARQKS